MRVPLLLSVLTLCAVLAVPPAPAQQSGADAPALSAEDLEAVGRAERALDLVREMKADFVQIGPNGEAARGTFYLDRPGRLRFEYDAPAPYLIIADRVWLVLIDRELQQVNRWPIFDTPLGVLLADNIDLRDRVEVVQVDEYPGALAVTVRDRGAGEEGLLTLVFEKPSMRLFQWHVRDATGGITTVSLTNQDYDPDLNAGLFVATEGAIRRAYENF